MKLLVIDNYDSFTYNLVDMFAAITGVMPVVRRNDETPWSELAAEDFDAIVLSPGPGHPGPSADFGVCREAIEKSSAPLLGICLGHQGIALANGTAIMPAPEPVHGMTSAIEHNGWGLFENVPSPLRVARYHSLIARPPLPGHLEVTAWTGDGLVMALAHRERPQWGLQFHPESIITEHGYRILENFCRLASKGGHHPRPAPETAVTVKQEPPISAERRQAFWREIPGEADAEAVFHALFGGSPHAFWLDSALAGYKAGRWSYLGDAAGPNAAVVSYDCLARSIRIEDAAGARVEQRYLFDFLDEHRLGQPLSPPPCPFHGGYVGWFGYEMRHDCGAETRRGAKTPDGFFIRADRFVAVDHAEGKTCIVAVDEPGQALRAAQWLDATEQAIRDARRPPSPQPARSPTPDPMRLSLYRNKQSYLEDIRRCLDWIRRGETYQVCLTNELRCRSDTDPFALYRVMRTVAPAPYAAFLKWPGGAVLCASPERFLSVDAEGHVETKPIKGTIRRDPDPQRDGALAGRLRASAKDRAENVMIVDLLRNDLAKSCQPGSVHVPKLFDVESYPTVHQLVSTVRGTLRPGKSTMDLIRGLFPGGSMTGAPKRRTMEFIDQLEDRPRGVYSGSLGWLGDDGAAGLNIVIRTMVVTGGEVSIGVGGGIVHASTPEGEYEEMLLKAEVSIRTLAIATTGEYSLASCHLVEDGMPDDGNGARGGKADE